MDFFFCQMRVITLKLLFKRFDKFWEEKREKLCNCFYLIDMCVVPSSPCNQSERFADKYEMNAEMSLSDRADFKNCLSFGVGFGVESSFQAFPCERKMSCHTNVINGSGKKKPATFWHPGKTCEY